MPQTTNDLLETNILGPDTRQWGIASGSCSALKSCGIHSLGISDVGHGYKIVRLKPSFSHINICLEGSGYHLIRGEWVELEEGTAIIRPAGDPQGAWHRAHHRWQMAWVIFDVHSDPIACCCETVCRLTRTDPVLWKCALDGLHRELETAIDPHHLTAWTDAVLLLSQRVLHGQNDRLAPLWQHVEAKLSHPWTVSELALRAGMSEVHLRRLTHARWHHSPMQHVSWLRIRRAEYLFSLPGQTVEMVASMVGYQSTSSFTSAFKRWLGRSPRNM